MIALKVSGLSHSPPIIMTSIVAVTLGVSDGKALAICVLFLIPFTGLYVALGGLWGVLWTDLFQFALKMAIVIGVAWYAVAAAGGMSTLLARLAEMRTAAGPNAGDPTAFFPDLSRPLTQEAIWVLPVLAFLVNIGVQWWAFWYPGAEPGGGGYIAQRIFSAKDERNGLLSVLWFNVAHYALRPWPWILTALAAIVLYPHLEHPETGYMGKQYAQQVESSVKLIQDPVVTEYVNRVGQNLVRNSDAQVPFTIKVIDSDDINAFALPGGFFYVNSGLILAADEEAELAGVMAHEIAHVAACHAARENTRGNLMQMASIPLIFVGGAIGYAGYEAAGLALPLTFLHFSRGFEAEADYLGLQYMGANFRRN